MPKIAKWKATLELDVLAQANVQTQANVPAQANVLVQANVLSSSKRAELKPMCCIQANVNSIPTRVHKNKSMQHHTLGSGTAKFQVT